MANTRMRKTFAYPDSDNDSEPDDLDEEEQEKLIEHLMQADAQKTENYKVCQDSCVRATMAVELTVI